MKYILIAVFIYGSLFGENLETASEVQKSQNTTNPASNVEFKKGLEAQSKNDFATAFKYLEPLAKNGESSAQLAMATMLYWGGHGITKNIAESIKWYTLSANQGDDSAQYKLGEMYYHGTEVKQNIVEAVKWYTASANKGNSVAQARLGYMFTFGEGIPVNNSEAIKWYALAINNGNQKAKCDIFEPLLASNNTREAKQEAKALLTKAYNETHNYQCKLIYDRYKLQNF
ncbi:MAG: tetratricopeptide repeat protein [Sulfurimonas sp.]|nr:tetratricopeptide repeat protein [Sulfurimonas sp.]